jgi:type II secretory pathway pseudopilin PulG
LAKYNSSSAVRTGESGFSLIETMVATLLLLTGVVSTAHLFVIATQSNIAAQRTTYAATLAQEKMEQLRSLAWGFDEVGLPINDYESDVTVYPTTAAGGVGLSPSPNSALSANLSGYVDYLDRTGTSLGGGTDVPANTVYVRRWSIEPLPTNPNNTLILQVLVFTLGGRAADESGALLTQARDEARLVSVKTRKSR